MERNGKAGWTLVFLGYHICLVLHISPVALQVSFGETGFGETMLTILMMQSMR